MPPATREAIESLIQPEIDRKRAVLETLTAAVDTSLRTNEESDAPVGEATIFSHLVTRLKTLIPPDTAYHALAIAIIEMAKARRARGED